jgi:hypothetical protein
MNRDLDRPAADEMDPSRVPPLPAEMIEGSEQRPTGPAQRDVPAELHIRLADLRAGGPDAGPPGGWETVSAEQAAQQLAERGTDLASARGMVADYLCDTAQRVGVPADEVAGWGLDQGDLAAIAQSPPGFDAASGGWHGDGLDEGLDDGAEWSQ